MSRWTVQIWRHLAKANAVKFAFLHPAVLQSQRSPVRSPWHDLTQFSFSPGRTLVIWQFKFTVQIASCISCAHIALCPLIQIPINRPESKDTNSHLSHATACYQNPITATRFVSYVAMWGNHIQRVKIVINGSIIELVTYFKYLGYCIPEYKSDLEDKLQTYNKINGAIRRHFGKQMDKETKLRIHNITAKAALKFGSEALVENT